ncbi:hypothetical protein [Pantoea stewartii]|uniref:hypothetical protein n=1 Tax=Pantoea stewartii TaxID=66269 RepID=UPI0021E93132|nr:hypothetical protein [Pantoea stewartii]UYK96266.1 hypothetical protein NG832_13895 [Pantoea stewartii]
MNMQASEISLLVKHNSEEWHRMWNRLAEHPFNRSLNAPGQTYHGGEDWEYTETLELPSGGTEKRYLHHFRHRCHPVAGNVDVTVPASRRFTPQDSGNAYYHDFGQ